jgi:branched-chain amino acid transport system permease protein
VYGLLAVGYVLVYRLTGIVHFALGDLVGLGVFVAFVTAGQGGHRGHGSSWRFVLGLLVALAVVPALTAATWSGIIQPQVGRGSTLGWVAATVAIASRSRARVRRLRPPRVRLPDPIPFQDVAATGSSPSPGDVPAAIALRDRAGVALALLVEYVVGRTRFGRGSRRSPRTPRAHPWSAFRTTASSASRLRSSAGSRS